MARCRYRGAMLWAVGCLLMAGCSSAPLPEARRPSWESHSQKTAQVAPATPATNNEVQQSVVDAYAHYTQALIYDMNEQPELALEEFTKAALNDPANEELVLELTRRHIAKRQWDKALEVLVRATAVPNAAGEIYARLGFVQLQLGKNDEAAAAGQTAIKRAPASIDGYRLLFLINLQKSQPQGAQKILDQAAKVQNVTPEYCVELVELYTDLLQRAPSLKDSISTNAMMVLNRAVKLKPANPIVRSQLADGFATLGDTTNASKIYLQLLSKYEELPQLRDEVRKKLAKIYLGNHDVTNAMEQLKAVVQDDPGNGQMYYMLGILSYEERKLTDAEGYFNKALLFSDDNEDVYYKLAGIQVDLERPHDALATIAKARAKFPHGFVSEYLMAVAYARAKDYTNAVTAFASAELMGKTFDPKMLTAGFYFEVGAAHERTGDFDQAEKYFDKSLELSPNFPEALNYLGFMLADRNVKLEKAQQLIEKAVEMEPKSAAYVDSLGWVLYRLKRPQEALGHIQKAIKLSEEPDATLYDHLGDIYAALKQDDKAADAWRKSLSVEPNDQIKKKLEQSTGKKNP